MKKRKLIVNVDEDTELQARDIFNQLGLSSAAAVNMFLHAVVEHRGISFVSTLDYDQAKAFDKKYIKSSDTDSKIDPDDLFGYHKTAAYRKFQANIDRASEDYNNQLNHPETHEDCKLTPAEVFVADSDADNKIDHTDVSQGLNTSLSQSISDHCPTQSQRVQGDFVDDVHDSLAIDPEGLASQVPHLGDYDDYDDSFELDHNRDSSHEDDANRPF